MNMTPLFLASTGFKFIDWQKLWAILLKYWDKFLIEGVKYTLLISAITVFFGAILAAALALMKMSKIPPLRWLSAIYIRPFMWRLSAARQCCCSCISSISGCPC